jgi:murein DD-endopeptidase MepM/ murein hydrolase activator NlpD
MTRHLRWVYIPLAACLLTALAAEVVGPAQAQSRRGLRRKQRTLGAKIENLRGELRNLKAEQSTTRNLLTRAQVELGDAQDRLGEAASRLSRTRSTLKVVRQEHHQAQAAHLTQKKRMENRILAQWEAGNPSYVEVLLNSTSFADFAQRAEMTESIADRDHKLLADLLATRRRLALKQERLQSKEQEEADAKREVGERRNVVAQKAETAKQRVKAANSDRAEAERQLAAMEEASRDIEAMLARVQRAGSGAGAYAGQWSGSLLRPVPGRVTSGFGMRIHPLFHTRRFHDGVDLACGGGTPIHAADRGRVIHAGWWGPYGVAVIIDHGSGISTLYGHCERGSLRVGAGDEVRRGQIIAAVDSTGWSTGDHLHFSVRRYGTPTNPLSY